MFCRSCGARNDDNATQCTQCGAILQMSGASATAGAGAGAGAVTPPPNNLVFAIVVTVLCCLPFGIPAIVYAAQVNSKAQAGDMAGALESARRSRMWSWWALGVGLVFIALYAVLAIIAAIVENS
jgi:uncharacterized membrane protein YvbJ